MRSVWDGRARASIQISLRRNVAPALFCRVPVCVFSSKLVVFKQNSRRQSRLVFLKVCFYLIHFLMCAKALAGTTSQQIQPVKFQCERRQKSRWKTTRQMLQLPVLAAYIPLQHSLSLSAERRKHNHQADDTTCLPLSLHFTLSCCDQRNGGENTHKKNKKNKKKRERSWKRWPSDHVALPMFVGRFIFTKKKIVKKERSHQDFDVLKGAKTRAHVGSQYKYVEIYIVVYLGSGQEKEKRNENKPCGGWWVPAYLQRSPCCWTVHKNILNNRTRETFTTTQASRSIPCPVILQWRRLLFILDIIWGAREKERRDNLAGKSDNHK